MASKLFESVKQIHRLVSLSQNPEEKLLEDWEKCLRWLKSLKIRSAKVPNLDSVNSDQDLYLYLKVGIS